MKISFSIPPLDECLSASSPIASGFGSRTGPHRTRPMSAAIIFFLVSLLAGPALPAVAGEPGPRLFRTAADLQRAREQVVAFPEMRIARDALLRDSDANIAEWRARYPARRRSADELIELGKKEAHPPIPDVLTNATASIFAWTPERTEVIREQILICLGSRRPKGCWRDSGIHEGEMVMDFLKAYDLIAETGILSVGEKELVREEMHQAAHFFELWTLDNTLAPTNAGEPYCLNINLYPAAILGAIAMYYPDFPESPGWLRLAQEQIVKYLLTDFALDGAYGEESSGYFSTCMEAILEFLNASKNMGVHDYAQDEAVMAALRRTMNWRVNLIAPDRRTTAVGDAHRLLAGAPQLEMAARLLHDPILAWAGREIVKNATGPVSVHNDSRPDLLVVDLGISPVAPAWRFANFPFSGYVFFRSGWERDANYFLMKYGTTWIGRREGENTAVIGGHAHEDALEIEVHRKGIPLLVDPGIRGPYADYLRYGGYWKATISHNTLGLGNPQGYDRLDGKYAEHVRVAGAQFRYEQEQKIIGRGDFSLKAAGDVGRAGLISARVRTFAGVFHQRTAIWFRDDSLTIVLDEARSQEEQPYELYWQPIGLLLSNEGKLVFGDKEAQLAIVPVGPEKKTTIIQPKDPKAPPYYAALTPDFAGPDEPDGSTPRWANSSLVVQAVRAREADFVNVLIPEMDGDDWKNEPLGPNGRKFRSGRRTLFVVGRNNGDGIVTADGCAGMVELQAQKVTTYAIRGGSRLFYQSRPLCRVTLKADSWKPLYEPDPTCLVSLADKRATVGLAAQPMDEQLLIAPPRSGDKENKAIPLQIEVSLKVDQKPVRFIASTSLTEMPELVDADFERRISGWKPDPSAWRYLRREIPFQYDEATGMATIDLPAGITQLVWE